MYIVDSVQYDDVSVILFNLHNYTGTGLNAQHSTISYLARIYSYVHKQHSTISNLARIYSYVHKQHSTISNLARIYSYVHKQHSTISNLARIYSYVHKQHSTISNLARIYSYVHKQHSTLLKSSLKFYVLSVSLEQINFTKFKSLWTTCIGEVNKLVLVKGFRIRTSTHEIYK